MRIVLVAAVTADGFIARHTTHEADWTSKEDKRHFVELTKQLGTMVMGSTTFDTIGRALPGRRMIVMTRRPSEYQIEGIETFEGDAAALCTKLEAEGVGALAVIGGAKVYGQFLASGLTNEVVLTVEPKLFGTGIPLAAQSLELDLKLLSCERLGDNAVVLHYEIER